MLRRRGFTLVETMVSTMLIALTTTLLTGLFVYGMRQKVRFDGRHDLLLGAEKAMSRVLMRLSETRSSLVSPEASINGIQIPVARARGQNSIQFDSKGQPLWQAWMVYGWDSTAKTLWEAQQTIATPTSDATALAATKAATPASLSRFVLARSVQSFTVSAGSNSTWSVRILVRKGGYQMEIASSAVAQN